jgi:hypothetical protein
MKQRVIYVPQDEFEKILKEIQSIFNQQMNLLSSISYLSSKLKNSLNSKDCSNIFPNSNEQQEG